MFSQPPAVARNAINIQLIMEPLSASSLQSLGSILQLHAQQYPVRIGVFFVLQESDRRRLDGPYKKLTPLGQFLRYERLFSCQHYPSAKKVAQLGVVCAVPRHFRISRRLFVLMQEAFGKMAAWQFWLGLLQASGSPMRSPYDEYAAPETPTLSRKQVEGSFSSVWASVKVRMTRQRRCRRSPESEPASSDRPPAVSELCAGMQGQVPPQELGKLSVDKVMKDLQGGKMPAIDDLARRHAAHVSSRGVQGGPHMAINGLLNPVQANPMVCGQLPWIARNPSGELTCPYSCLLHDRTSRFMGHLAEPEWICRPSCSSSTRRWGTWHSWWVLESCRTRWKTFTDTSWTSKALPLCTATLYCLRRLTVTPSKTMRTVYRSTCWGTRCWGLPGGTTLPFGMCTHLAPGCGACLLTSACNACHSALVQPHLAALQWCALSCARGVQDFIKPVTHWLVLSVAAPDAAGMLASATEYIANGTAQQCRLAVMFECSGAKARAADALIQIIHAATSLPSRLDKVPAFLRGLAGDAKLWKRLATSRSGALESAVSLAGEFGLNVEAVQRILRSTASAEGIQVYPSLPQLVTSVHRTSATCLRPLHCLPRISTHKGT